MRRKFDKKISQFRKNFKFTAQLIGAAQLTQLREVESAQSWKGKMVLDFDKIVKRN